MIQAIESIRRSVVVPVAQDKAFEVFTSGMTGWWPSDHHITRHADGSETSTGYVAAWEPPERVVVTWQISAEWKYDPSLVTTVEVRFVSEAPDRTRVELEHRDLDRFGPDAERMHETFNAPGAWDATLAAYADGVRAAS
jgi:hypothetical protein